MQIVQLLQQIRQSYFDHLVTTLARLQKEGKYVLVEPILIGSDGQPLLEGTLNLPMRIDLFDVANSKSYRIDSEKQITFESFSAPWLSVQAILFSSFYWDACRISVAGLSPQNFSNVIKSWFNTNSKFDDDHYSGSGYMEVLHFVSDPVVNGSSTSIEIDLGSAQASALERLIYLLSVAGAESMHIGFE